MTNEQKAFEAWLNDNSTYIDGESGCRDLWQAALSWQKAELLKMLDDPAMVGGVAMAIASYDLDDVGELDMPTYRPMAKAALSTLKQMMENLPAFSIDTNQ